jgi:hypothetical protein
MPITRSARTLAAACLVLVTLLGVAPRPAAALEPPRPLPNYRPEFVTETDTRPWVDCLWASAAMLLDKWTNGDVQVSHGKLRHLSGDRGGSSFADLEVAFHKLGFDVPVDASGESTLTWSQLLTRLRKGAGAVVLGDYGNMPRRYARWDRRFWRKTGEDDNHAVYVERYDRRHHRVWIMDPLARGHWRGEWISVSALRRFAWSKGARVAAVTTPTAAPAPFAGVAAEQPQVELSATAMTATWKLRAGKGWAWRGGDVHVSMAAATDPIAAAIAAAQANPGTTADPAPEAPVAGVTGHTLRLSAALPSEPGAYVASLSLTDRRFGKTFVASEPMGVFVPGARRATLRLNTVKRVLIADDKVRISMSVANSGEETWADMPGSDTDQRDVRARATRVLATWVRLDPPAASEKGAGETAQTPADPAAGGATPAAGDEAAVAPLVVELGKAPLPPGAVARLRQTLVVPSEPGRWALVIDVMDDVAGSYAALGSAPAVALFELVTPPALAVAE